MLLMIIMMIIIVIIIMRKQQIKELEKTAILCIAHILRTVLTY